MRTCHSIFPTKNERWYVATLAAVAGQFRGYEINLVRVMKYRHVIEILMKYGRSCGAEDFDSRGSVAILRYDSRGSIKPDPSCITGKIQKDNGNLVLRLTHLVFPAKQNKGDCSRRHSILSALIHFWFLICDSVHTTTKINIYIC